MDKQVANTGNFPPSTFPVMYRRDHWLFGRLDRITKTWRRFYTVWDGTLVVPDDKNRLPWEIEEQVVWPHEAIHVEDQKRWSFPLFLFLYALFPLPFGLALCRLHFELKAMVGDIRMGRSPESVVAALSGKKYLYSAPAPMVRWLLRRYLRG